jgi:hypothetical protein
VADADIEVATDRTNNKVLGVRKAVFEHTQDRDDTSLRFYDTLLTPSLDSSLIDQP